MDSVPAGLPPRPSAEPGAESALLRTRSLLDSTSRQHKLILSNYRLAVDVRADELAALSLLRSLLEELESCIVENDNPPPTVSKRKALIKVEKARRSVLAAVRECAGRVTESQKLFEEIERFIELRPEEPVSPRNFPVRWSRKAPMSRNLARRRDQAHGRNMRPADSLVMSIVGLSAIAEGRERDTPTAAADLARGTAAHPLPPVPPGDKAKAPQPHHHHPAGAAAPRPQAEEAAAAAARRRPDGVGGGHLQDISNTVVAAAAVAGAGGAADKLEPQGGRGCGPTSASQVIKNATLLLQRMQLQQHEQPPRTTNDSVDAEAGDEDLRPSLSHDVAAPSSATTTTMCNMDSCVSGPQPRTMISGVGETGYEDGDEDEDEVNSAERRCYDADSPDHRVSLLGCARTAAAAVAAAARSTASTPPHPDGQQARGSGAGLAAAAPEAAPMGPPAATEAASRSQESLTGNRSYLGAESRRRVSATDATLTAAAAAAAAVAQQPQARAAAAGGGPFSASGSEASAFLAEGIQADAAAAELDEIGLMAAARPLAPPPPAPRYGMTRHQHAAAPLPPSLPPQYSSAAAAAAGSPQLQQHPAHAAALAAAAAHPYGANGFSHPPLHLLHVATNPHPAYAAGAAAQPHPNFGPHSVPPSVPSSLRDYPIAGQAAARVGGGSGGGAVVLGQGHGRRYGGSSQPVSAHQSLDSGQFPATATITTWDNVSLADTEPPPGAAPGQRSRRGGRRRGGGGLMGIVRNVVGFVGVSVLSGAAMVLGAAAVNTGLDEQEAAQQARQHKISGRRGQQRLGRGGDDLIPQRTLQQLRSPDLLALGRG
ncbi:hypothetical protein PLESTF_001263300 [Pleodorina starrii]|nr:hypothetical protein PLESTF_001263300 [Pleodorina starrii]